MGRGSSSPFPWPAAPRHAPASASKASTPGFHTTLATLGYHLLEVWGSSGTAVLSGFHIVPFSMVLKMHTSSRPCFHPSGAHTYLQEWDCQVPWWFQLCFEEPPYCFPWAVPWCIPSNSAQASNLKHVFLFLKLI